MLSTFSMGVRALAVLRVALALVLLGDLATRLPDLELLYTDEGVMPRSIVDSATASSAFPFPHPDHVSLHLLSGDASVEVALFALAGVLALALLVGWHTRIATIGSWFLLMSLHNRNTFINNGGDHLLRLLLMWCMFLPLGAWASVDERRRRPAQAASPATSAAAIASIASIASAGLILQLCAMYWVSGFVKLFDPTWRSGEAIRLVLSSGLFARPMGVALAPNASLLKALTWLTLALELLGPCVLFIPYRRRLLRAATAIAFIVFHVALAVTLYLDAFPIICIAAWTGVFAWAIDDVATSAPRLHVSRASNWAAGALLILGIVVNVRYAQGFVGRPHWQLSAPIRKAVNLLRLDQRWGLFSSPGTLFSGWWVTKAARMDGSIVDLTTRQPVSFAKPKDVVATWYADKRGGAWQDAWSLRSTYIPYRLLEARRAGNPDAARYGAIYAEYLCRTVSPEIREVELIYLEADAAPEPVVAHVCANRPGG